MFPIPEFPLRIIRRLQKAGYEAFVVGGAVRDLCLKRTAVDWDITTSATPSAIRSLFKEFRKFSLKHETVTLVHEGRHFEITPFRKSKGAPRSIVQDLGARDFTINAMALDVEKKRIIDPYRGKRDLSKRIIKAVQNPKDRFAEDPLRLLRGIRLAVELDFRIELKTKQALHSMADQIKSAAQERIRAELIKILSVCRPSRAFLLMQQTGLLAHILPELAEGYRKRQNPHFQLHTIFKHTMVTVDTVRSDPLLRLSALFHDIAKPRVRTRIDGQYRFIGHETAGAELASAIMRRLGFGRTEIKKVCILVREHMLGYHSGWSDGAIRRLVQRVGINNVNDLMELRRADLAAHGLAQDSEDLLKELENRVRKLRQKPFVIQMRELAINGTDVMRNLDLPPGPKIGQILHFLMEAVIEDPHLNTPKRLKDIVRKIKQNQIFEICKRSRCRDSNRG